MNFQYLKEEDNQKITNYAREAVRRVGEHHRSAEVLALTADEMTQSPVTVAPQLPPFVLKVLKDLPNLPGREPIRAEALHPSNTTGTVQQISTLVSPLIRKREDETLTALRHLGFICSRNVDGTINFGGEFLKITEPVDQKAALSLLLNHKYRGLNLSHCGELTEEQLKKFIEKSGDHLRWLDVSHCKEISHTFFGWLEKSCPNIEIIVLGNNEKLLSIQRAFKFPNLFKSRFYIFRCLRELHISNCEHLSSIRIVAPVLGKLTLLGNPSLKMAAFESCYWVKITGNPDPKSISIKWINTPTDRQEVESTPLSHDGAGRYSEENHSSEVLQQLKVALLDKSPNLLRQIASNYEMDSKDSVVHRLIEPWKEEVRQFCSQNNVEIQDVYQFFLNESFRQVAPDEEGPLTDALKHYTPFIANPTGHVWTAAEVNPLTPRARHRNAIDKVIEEILALIKKGEAALEAIRDKNVIILIGNSGCGKSTTTNFLLGRKMVLTSRGDKEINLEEGEKNDLCAEIGHELGVSKTEVPTAFPFNDNTVLCDMPGFGDLNGLTVSIAHAVNMKHFYGEASQIRILFLFSYEIVLADRGKSLIEALNLFVASFGEQISFEKARPSILFGGTTLDESITDETAKRKLTSAGGAHTELLAQMSKQFTVINPMKVESWSTVVDRLNALTPINEKLNIQTVFNPEEEKFIDDLAKQVLAEVEKCWENREILQIVEEYQKLKSLDCIGHRSITKALEEFRALILSYVTTRINTLKQVMKSHEPIERQACKDLMWKLLDCKPLDDCFDAEKEKISQLIKDAEQELLTSEKGMQKEANDTIAENFNLLQRGLGDCLERSLRQKRGEIAKLGTLKEGHLKALGEIVGVQLVQHLLTHFDQSAKERMLRPYKYFHTDSGLLDALDILVANREEEVSQLIASAFQRAKREELAETFNRIYDQLLNTIDQIVEEHFRELQITRYTVDHFSSLKKYYIEHEIEKMDSCLKEMEESELFEDKLSVYYQKVDDFLKLVHNKSKNLFVAERIKINHKLINEGLKGNFSLGDEFTLRDAYRELFFLNSEEYKKALKLASDLLFVEPLRGLTAIITRVDERYKDDLQGLQLKEQQMLLVSKFLEEENLKEIPLKEEQMFLFSRSLRKEDLEEIDLKKQQMLLVSTFVGKEEKVKEKWGKEWAKVKKGEEQRKKQDITEHETVFHGLLIMAEPEIKRYANNHSLDHLPKNVEDNLEPILNTLQGVGLPVAPLLKAWENLKRAASDEGKRYFFLTDKTLLAIKTKNKNAIVKTIKYCVLWSKIIRLKEKFDRNLKALEGEADGIIKNEDKARLLVEHGLRVGAGFSSKLIDDLSNELALFNIFSVESNTPEIVEQCSNAKKSWEKLEESLVSRAKTASVKSLTQDLILACNDIKIINLDEFLYNLDFLYKQSDESYQLVINTLRGALSERWQGEKLDYYFYTPGQMANAITHYNWLQKVKERLIWYLPDLDLTATEVGFQRHFDMLLEKATSDIESVGHELTDLKNFLAWVKHFLGINTQFSQGAVSLMNTALKKWRTVVEQLRDPSLNNIHLAQFAEELIKHFRVAKELHLSDKFKDTMLGAFDLLSDDQINTLGKCIEKRALVKGLSGSANDVIDQFPAFFRIRILTLNRKMGQIDFEDALQRLGGDVDNPSKIILRLGYQEFQTFYPVFLKQILNRQFDKNKQLERVGQLSKLLKVYVRKGDNGALLGFSIMRKEVVELLAIIFALWTYENAKLGCFRDGMMTGEQLLQPHATQILTIFRMLGIDEELPNLSQKRNGIKNHLGQVGTGEGKSIQLGVLGVLFAILDCNVKIACYSTYLSTRDKELFRPLFEMFNSSDSISYTTYRELSNSLKASGHLPDLRDRTLQFLKGESVPVFIPKRKIDIDVLLIDEVDVLFGKGFIDSAYQALVEVSSEAIEELIRYVWENRVILREQTLEEAIDRLNQLDCVDRIVQDFPRLKPFIANELNLMVNALKEFPEGKCLHDCRVDGELDQIYYIDDWGNHLYNIRSDYRTTFAYFFYNENGMIKDVKKVNIPLHVGGFLYSSLPSHFELKLGLSATLEALTSDEKEILTNHGFEKKSLIPTTYKRENQVVVHEPELHYTEAAYHQSLYQKMYRMVESGRACLIVFKNIKRLEDFEKKLADWEKPKGFSKWETLTENTKDNDKKDIVNMTCLPYAVTLISRAFGRGIDYLCRDQALIDAGGLHVIPAFYPETKSEEVQIFGRTGRQDNPGSVGYILFADDLIADRLASWNEGMDKISLTEGTLIDTLAKNREAQTSKRMLDIQSNSKRNQVLHDETFQLSKAMEEADIEKAQKILMGFQKYR